LWNSIWAETEAALYPTFKGDLHFESVRSAINGILSSSPRLHAAAKDKYGKDSYGKDKYGKDSYGKDSYGKDLYDEASYGEASYGQDGYGKDQVGYGKDQVGSGKDEDGYGKDQEGYGQVGYGQDGESQERHGRDQDGYGQVGYGQEGESQERHGRDQDGYGQDAYGLDQDGYSFYELLSSDLRRRNADQKPNTNSLFFAFEFEGIKSGARSEDGGGYYYELLGLQTVLQKEAQHDGHDESYEL